MKYYTFQIDQGRVSRDEESLNKRNQREIGRDRILRIPLFWVRIDEGVGLSR